MLISSFDKTIHTCKIVRIVLVDIYEGCQESSWTPMIKASDESNFDIQYYVSLK